MERQQYNLFDKTSCAVCGKVMEQIESTRVYYFDQDGQTQCDVVCGEAHRIDFYLNLMRKEGL